MKVFRCIKNIIYGNVITTNKVMLKAYLYCVTNSWKASRTTSRSIGFLTPPGFCFLLGLPMSVTERKYVLLLTS